MGVYKSSFFIQQIDAVLSASLSVFRSSRLKKVFEVINNQYDYHILPHW